MLNNFNSIYSLAQTLYGTQLTPSQFEDIALNGWERIGNKHTRLYKYVSDTTNKEIELPCNVDVIESVTYPILDTQETSNKTVFNQVNTLFIENYIEAWKTKNDPLYTPGKYVKYRQSDNSLVFSRDYTNITIIYHGVIVDEEGLPLLTDKEVNALAAFIAYSDLYKKSLVQRSGDLMNLANIVKQDWLKFCSSSRIPDKLTQNDMDAILDVRVRWDRKMYGKSLKSIL